jgi:hypothetical protein
LESACGFRRGDLTVWRGFGVDLAIVRRIALLRAAIHPPVGRSSSVDLMVVGIRLRFATWWSDCLARVSVDLAIARRIALLRAAIHPPVWVSPAYLFDGGWNPLAASDMAV